ncbi:MAG: methionyl-tRNA formyltransferase [Anaerolineales bacterium]
MSASVVFMGSPDFALPTLQALAQAFNMVGVVTQPDRPAGRGRRLTPPPVKTLADSLGIPVIQPRRLKEPQALDQLLSWKPDVVVVAAFGQILPQNVLDLPPFGCVNVHASLLPRWRGAAPIQAAILAGDDHTGITIMCMDAGLDTGPILSQNSTAISAADTAGSLSDRLAEMGSRLLIETLPSYLAGEIIPQAQEQALATYAPKIEKSAGELDFTQSAAKLTLAVRAYNPWPGAYFYWNQQRMILFAAHAVSGDFGPAGARTTYDNFPAIVTGDGLLVLDLLQLAGKPKMFGDVFLRGARRWHSDPVDSV